MSGGLWSTREIRDGNGRRAASVMLHSLVRRRLNNRRTRSSGGRLSGSKGMGARSDLGHIGARFACRFELFDELGQRGDSLT